MAQQGPTGGPTAFTLVTAATTNPTLVKAGKAQLVSFMGGNVNAAARFVKFYDTAVSQTSAYTDTPILNLLLPGNATGAGSNIVQAALPPYGGTQFQNGLAFQVTANIALADQSAVSAGDCTINLTFL